MKKKRLLDSFALLAYLNQEDGFDKVRRLLADAQKSSLPVLMNEMNVGETYYIIHRKRGHEQAEYFLGPILTGLPISVISVASVIPDQLRQWNKRMASHW